MGGDVTLVATPYPAGDQTGAGGGDTTPIPALPGCCHSSRAGGSRLYALSQRAAPVPVPSVSMCVSVSVRPPPGQGPAEPCRWQRRTPAAPAAESGCSRRSRGRYIASRSAGGPPAPVLRLPAGAAPGPGTPRLRLTEGMEAGGGLPGGHPTPEGRVWLVVGFIFGGGDATQQPTGRSHVGACPYRVSQIFPSTQQALNEGSPQGGFWGADRFGGSIPIVAEHPWGCCTLYSPPLPPPYPSQPRHPLACGADGEPRLPPGCPPATRRPRRRLVQFVTSRPECTLC